MKNVAMDQESSSKVFSIRLYTRAGRGREERSDLRTEVHPGIFVKSAQTIETAQVELSGTAKERAGVQNSDCQAPPPWGSPDGYQKKGVAGTTICTNMKKRDLAFSSTR
jgi:hypothetical protein